MKRHYIFASHGTFANGLLNSVELILGKQPDIHTLCAYVEEEADLTQQVETLLAACSRDDAVWSYRWDGRNLTRQDVLPLHQASCVLPLP